MTEEDLPPFHLLKGPASSNVIHQQKSLTRANPAIEQRNVLFMAIGVEDVQQDFLTSDFNGLLVFVLNGGV